VRVKPGITQESGRIRENKPPKPPKTPVNPLGNSPQRSPPVCYSRFTTRVGVPLSHTRVGVPLSHTRVCATQVIHQPGYVPLRLYTNPGICWVCTPPGYMLGIYTTWIYHHLYTLGIPPYSPVLTLRAASRRC